MSVPLRNRRERQVNVGQAHFIPEIPHTERLAGGAGGEHTRVPRRTGGLASASIYQVPPLSR